MGPYINRRTLLRFMSMARSLVEKRAVAVRCSQRRIRMAGLDLDAEYRTMRLMAKLGYMSRKEEGGYDLFAITPKGIALYDTMLISYSKQP